MKSLLLGVVLLTFSASTVSAALVNNGDGTVTDTETRLMWQQQPVPVAGNWQEALEYCEDLTDNGHEDWHLPDVQELHSLADFTNFNTVSINQGFFPGTADYDYWTSTTYDGYPDYVWTVSFVDGRITFLQKSEGAYIRAVRYEGGDHPIQEYLITPSIIGQGSMYPDYPFLAEICSTPNLFPIYPYAGWHLDTSVEIGGTAPGTLYSEANMHRFELAKVSGPGTVIANFVWDNVPGPDADTDHDGIDDQWEIDNFGDLTTANRCTDYDGDNYSDIAEYRHEIDENLDSDGGNFNPTVFNPPHLICVNPDHATIDTRSCLYESIMSILWDHRNEPVEIKLFAGELTEDLMITNSAVYLFLRGGFDPDLSEQLGMTTINGTITISGGYLEVENIVIK